MTHYDCPDCGEDGLVALLDESMLPDFKAGNKYSRCCLSCDSYLGMTSERTFRRYVEDGRGHFLPVEGDRYNAETHLNYFYCPSCDVGIPGRPDSCPECDVSYNWTQDD